MTSSSLTIDKQFDTGALATFVQLANKFKSEITLSTSEHKINAKSIMGVISLISGGGQALSITADGPDESEALKEMVMFFN